MAVSVGASVGATVSVATAIGTIASVAAVVAVASGAVGVGGVAFSPVSTTRPTMNATTRHAIPKRTAPPNKRGRLEPGDFVAAGYTAEVPPTDGAGCEPVDSGGGVGVDSSRVAPTGVDSTFVAPAGVDLPE